MGKEEIAHNELFSSNLKLSSANSFSSEESKICSLRKSLGTCILSSANAFNLEL